MLSVPQEILELQYKYAAKLTASKWLFNFQKITKKN